MMATNKQALFTKEGDKKLLVVREFDAPVDEVWKAWTDANVLDAWWAPRPWKTETKKMDFKEGGLWLYCMVGPEGEKHWCKVSYETIEDNKGFTAIDAFCDEEGNTNTDFPAMHWKTVFLPTPSGSKVEVEISFNSEADMEKIVEMGFKEGFGAALGNLDEVLKRRAV